MNKRLSPGFLLLTSLFALLLSTGCKKKDGDVGKPVVLITGTESYPVVKFTVENTPSTYLVSATFTEKASEDIRVSFALDTAAVATFNKTHNTTYFVAPAAAVDLSNLETVIKAGSSISSSATVKVISTS